MVDAMGRATASAEYDDRAQDYAANRRVNPAVRAAMIESNLVSAQTRVLDVGCGTGNYGAALRQATGCRVSGIDPSREMLARARKATTWESLVQGGGESLPCPDASFDVVMTTDVIHHIGDRDAYFHEANRVLRPGGRIVTVTDSHDVIPLREPLSNFFPETVAIELRRYPPVPQILTEMARAGFSASRVNEVQHPYQLTDLEPYRSRAFSSLLLIDNAAFQRGLDRLESARREGPIPCISRYTMIWASKPAGAIAR